MTSKTYMLASQETGRFLDRVMMLPAGHIAANTPAGYRAVEIDPAAPPDPRWQRLDTTTGRVATFTPAGDDDTEWSFDAVSARWTASPTLARAKQMRLRPIDAKLAALDSKAIRPTSEIAHSLASRDRPPPDAIAALGELIGAKDALRATRAAIAAAATKSALDAIPGER